MILRLTLALSILFSFALSPVPAHAQWKSFLKKVQPKPEEKKGASQGNSGQEKSKTERLILGGIKTIKGLLPIGYEEEMAIGGAVALEAVSRFGGLVDDPSLELYVAVIGSAVATTSDRPEIPYHFGILNTDEPNAFAAPGGYIFVSKGLLKMAKSEAELAGILGHEIAHVSKKHALNAIRQSKAIAGLSEVTLSALDQDPAMFDSVVKETMNTIFERGLGRTKEIEADRIGTDFAYRVGYNPTGLRSFLQILGKVPGKKGGVFKTHPGPADRVNQLTKVLQGSDYAGSNSLPLYPGPYEHSMKQAKL